MSDGPEIIMYRTSTCPYCVMAAEMLRGMGIEFQEEMLDDHPDRRGFTNSILRGHHTVPLVLVGGEPIGGFDDLRRLHGEGRLEDVLRGR